MSTKLNFRLSLYNGVLTRNVDPYKHFFFKYRAYAYDEEELQRYRGLWHTLEIVTTEGKCYQIGEEDFYNSSYLNTDYGKVQRLIGVADMVMRESIGKTIKISNDLYRKLREESKRSGQSISELLERKI